MRTLHLYFRGIGVCNKHKEKAEIEGF